MLYLIILVFVAGMGLYNYYLIKDDQLPEEDPRNKKYENLWHFVGAICFCDFAFTVQYLYSKMLNGGVYQLWVGWDYALFVLASFWLIFAGIVHRAFGQPVFYVGERAATDRFLRWLAQRTGMKVTVTAMIVKLFAFVMTLLATFV